MKHQNVSFRWLTIVAVLSTVLSLFITPNTIHVNAQTYIGSDRLGPGQKLLADQMIQSADGRFTLVMQQDGNLVAYQNSDHRPFWASNTQNSGATQLVMQGDDGNLVLYTADGTPVWASGTVGEGGAYLVMQSDRNIVIYHDGGAIWATNTQEAPLVTIQRLNLPNPDNNDFLYTANGEESTRALQLGYIRNNDAFRCSGDPSDGTVPLFRLYHPESNHHFYTSNPEERRNLIAQYGWRDEGSLCNIYQDFHEGTYPLYRLLGPRGEHLYTISRGERDHAHDYLSFSDEGTIGWVYPAQSINVTFTLDRFSWNYNEYIDSSIIPPDPQAEGVSTKLVKVDGSEYLGQSISSYLSAPGFPDSLGAIYYSLDIAWGYEYVDINPRSGNRNRTLSVAYYPFNCTMDFQATGVTFHSTRSADGSCQVEGTIGGDDPDLSANITIRIESSVIQ